MSSTDNTVNYRNETKEGYLVPSILKRSWYAQIEILKYVDEICRENNIKYIADCGTLLGAIRHKGFIPWDDDIDLAMLRSDYIRFRDIVLEKSTDFVKIKCFKNREGFTDFKILVTNDNIIDFSKERLEGFCGFPFATGIDIFPYDYLPNSEEEKTQLYKDIIFALTVKDMIEKDDDSDNQREKISQLEERFNCHINENENIIHQINLAIEKRMSQYPEEKATLVTHIPDWIKKRNTEYSKDIFDNLVYMKFENTCVPVSSKYEEQLKVQYGEYIEMVKGFAGHDFPYFIDQITEAINTGVEKSDLRLFEYNDKLLEREKCSAKKDNKNKYIENINLQGKIICLVIKLIAQSNVEESLNMLQMLQESAMRLGNSIEISLLSNRVEAVKTIERFCEYVYESYIVLSQESEGDISENLKCLANDLDKITELVETGVFEQKKRIAIFFSHRSDWDILEQIYNEKCKENETIVYPILLPYYDLTNTLEQGEMHFEDELLPKELKTYDFESIDFENDYFDEIYYTNAFEKFDWGEISLPLFYSRNLQKISPKIVFVQSLIIDDFESDNVPMIYSAKEYICTPGVVQADEIWVHSEKIGKHFEDILSEASGEQKRKYWQSRIKMVPYDNAVNKKVDKISKKQIFVYINLSQLSTLKEEKLVQINKIINDMKGYTIDLCWDKAIDEYMSNYDNETYFSFCEFIKMNSNCGRIRVVDFNEINIAEYVAYAGDRSWLTNAFVSEGKKVYLFEL